MLCPSVFQPSPLSLRPMVDFHWPIRSLWPDTRPIFYQMEQEMLRHLQEMKQNMEYMERLHQKIFDDIDQASGSKGVFAPISFQEVPVGGGSFALSLDTQDFQPQELSVKQVGRKLRVSGRTERKQEDGKGSYSYRCQEFRQELDLPDGVDPENVSCSLAGGRLQIQAPRPQHDGKERVVPISVTSVPAITSSSSSGGAEPSSSSSSESVPAEKN